MTFLFLVSMWTLYCAVPSVAFAPFGKVQVRSAAISLNGATDGPSQFTNEPLVIALTRELGKNRKLRDELLTKLETNLVQLEELPCIAHADGPDLDRLGSVLMEGDFDYVAVTSPEAAKVLGAVWNDLDRKEWWKTTNQPAVTAVGKATEAALLELGISVEFCPSKATAKTLVAELPAKGENTSLLYPASAKAPATLQDGLTARGFQVTRLNTYDTVTATWTEQEEEIGNKTQIACFGSPSAVHGWLKNCPGNSNVMAACIGETSAAACREQGFPESHIYFPEKPGIPGWAEAVTDALQSLETVPEFLVGR